MDTKNEIRKKGNEKKKKRKRKLKRRKRKSENGKKEEGEKNKENGRKTKPKQAKNETRRRKSARGVRNARQAVPHTVALLRPSRVRGIRRPLLVARPAPVSLQKSIPIPLRIRKRHDRGCRLPQPERRSENRQKTVRKRIPSPCRACPSKRHGENLSDCIFGGDDDDGDDHVSETKYDILRRINRASDIGRGERDKRVERTLDTDRRTGSRKDSDSSVAAAAAAVAAADSGNDRLLLLLPEQRNRSRRAG